ncbi:metal cation symporter ZIP8 [Amia ocellicauda]|uniref:metal cation symporter ZIP8 n=1 Tax=Amia ocellicauda TaxID=2972642 RepID=UPI0034639FDE
MSVRRIQRSCGLIRAVVLLAAAVQTLRATEMHPSHGFLQDIFQVYGENGTLCIEDLQSLLETVGGKRNPDNVGVLDTFHNLQCLSGKEILSLHGLTNESRLTEVDFQNICPAILQQAVLQPCPIKTPESNLVNTLKPVPYQVWGYGVLSVTIINLASLLGLILVPFTKKPYFPKVLTYFIGLAIGTLYSNAVLQLIPEALGFDPKRDNYVLQAVGIFGGFYVLFFMEKILKIALKTEHQHSHSHFTTPEDEECHQEAEKGGASPAANGELSHNTQVITVTSFGSSNEVNIVPVDHEEDVQLSRGYCRWLRGPGIANIKTVAWMITLSDAVHNFIDGLAIGASFTVSMYNGVSTSIAIVCEEFPHELGDFVILLNAGMSIPQAMFFNLLSACSCYIGLVLGIIVGSNFSPNIIFAFAGGMFLYIALADMFPEMNDILKPEERTTKNNVVFFIIQNAGLLTGFAIILLITMFAGQINFG